MISKNTITYIRSLHTRAGRDEARAFIVEGEKNIAEFLDSDFRLIDGYFTLVFIQKHEAKLKGKRFTPCSESEIERMTTLKTNNAGVAVFEMKNTPKDSLGGIVLVLDDINDPGNLGTIIRTADWYGVRTIIASEMTVDAYNPKVIMASMGSMTRVAVLYRKLESYLAGVTGPVLGAYLEGGNLHTIASFPKDLHLVIGSESHGISKAIAQYITQKITIPRFGGAESLNAGIATAVVLDNLMRKSE